MKKLLLIVALLFVSCGVFADKFDDLVTVLRTNGKKQGWNVRSDKAKRVVFIDVKLPNASEGITQEQFDEVRPVFIDSFKKSIKEENVPAFKKLNITLRFSFTTTDGKTFKLVIAPCDL
jgi:hypothetical protein